MSENTKNPEVPVAASEESSTGVTSEQPNVDHLLHENKKYRARAQDSEAKVAELEKQFASIEEASLKEKEDFKALYEKVSSENESLSSTAKKWESYEKSRRESLLELVPEAEREKLEKLDLDTLEYVTDKIKTKPNAPEVAGEPRGEAKALKVDWNDADSVKNNWNGILNQYTEQHKKVNLKK